ncbi:MAG: hypothetical protein FWC93_02580 [Defluviitaleaceae bacterium]|nr:hypothetical protein [Defluviitaleaceae bacterium]
MKGKEIINNIVREKMPDVEQVREACHARALEQIKPARRLRWSAVAAVVVLCLVFSTAAYAVGVMMSDRLDLGGFAQLVIIDEDEWDEKLRTGAYTRTIYFNRNNDVLRRFATWLPQFQPDFSAEDGLIINEMLAGKIFTADGEPFELMTTSFDGVYRVNDGSKVLYNAYGEEIGVVEVRFSIENEEILDTYLITREVFEAQHGYNATLKEAVEFLGRDFHIPASVGEGFEAPAFRLEDWYRSDVDDETGQYLRTGGRSVVVRYLYTAEKYFGGRDMFMLVENVRSEHITPVELTIGGGEFIERQMAGIVVHQLASDRMATFITWEHDGLIYTIYPPTTWMTADIEEIIRSIIE